MTTKHSTVYTSTKKATTASSDYPKTEIRPRHQISAQIVIDHETMQLCRYLVAKVSPKEVQWFMTVHKDETVQNGKRHIDYYIDGVYIPDQEVAGAEADTSPQQMYQLMQHLKNEHRLYDDEGEDIGPDMEEVNNIVSHMHVWCHSHPFGPSGNFRTASKVYAKDYGSGIKKKKGTPHPSGQDERNFREWIQRNESAGIETPVIMLIFGNDEGIYSRVHDPDLTNFWLYSVPINVLPPDYIDYSEIDDAIAARVTTRTTRYLGTGGRWVNGRYVNYGTGGVGTTTPAHSTSYQSSAGTAAGRAYSKARSKKDFEAAQEKAFRAFDKHFQGDLRQFFAALNKTQNNEKEVRHLHQFLSRWLTSPEEWWIFHVALWGTDPELDELVKDEPKWETDEDVLIFLISKLASDVLLMAEAHETITWVKRFIKKTQPGARKMSIEAFKKKRDESTHMFLNSDYGWDSDWGASDTTTALATLETSSPLDNQEATGGYRSSRRL